MSLLRVRPLLAVALAGALLGLPATVSPVGPAQADQVREREYWLADYGIENAWSLTRGSSGVPLWS